MLVGQELSKQLEMSLGATLESQPGVAARSFGPATARPVIRGLDGDRVLILQDGQRMGDLSSQSADHGGDRESGVGTADRSRARPGDAPLWRKRDRRSRECDHRGDSDDAAAGRRRQRDVRCRVGGEGSWRGGRRAGRQRHVCSARRAAAAAGSDDVDTPEGEIVNSQSRSGFGNIGLSWTGAKGYFGGSYGYDDTKLGIPVVEDGILQSTPRKHSAIVLRAGGHDLTGAFDSFRATLTVRRYKHEELEGDEVGTAFKNDTNEFELMGSHRAIGRLKGSLGAWFLGRAFDAVGAEALSPAVDQRGFAGFLYEEVTWPHVTLQFGGRVDNARYAPLGRASGRSRPDPVRPAFSCVRRRPTTR